MEKIKFYQKKIQKGDKKRFFLNQFIEPKDKF